MNSDNIEKLYKNYAILDEAKDKISEIRKQAVKDLPSLCKDNKEHTQRIADILSQLLQTDDSTELIVVNNALLTVFKNDPKAALSGIFSQIHNESDSDTVRERCIQFIASKIKHLGKDIINKDCEDLIITECKKVLQDITAIEFEHIMDLLSWTRLGKTLPGKREILGLVATQVLADGEWIPTEQESVDRIIQCVSYALPYFSSQLESTQFVNYFCEHVIPKLDQVSPVEVDAGDPKLELLKLFAELTMHCGALENPEEKINIVYNCLMNYLPEPPVEIENENKEAGIEAGTPSTPSLQFSHTECSLFALHALCKKEPTILSKDVNKLKALRQRLQYTARLTQGYIKKLKEATTGKTPSELKSEENKIKLVALKTTSNINILIRDLFHTPPSFKSTVHLSFESKHAEKTIENPTPKETPRDRSPVAQKRHKPITFGDGDRRVTPEKRPRNDRSNYKVYQPPSGKYSNNISGNSMNYSRGGRFRGGGRRDFRNGGGRNFNNGFRRRF